jgi:hypothetical protein
LDLSDGQADHNQIEDDVDASRCPGVGVQVEAFATMLAIPSIPSQADGKTLQSRRRYKGDNVQHTEQNCEVYDASKPLVGKDPEIEEQDRYLGQPDRRQVKKLGKVENLVIVSQNLPHLGLRQLTSRIFVILSKGTYHMSFPIPISFTS